VVTQDCSNTRKGRDTSVCHQVNCQLLINGYHKITYWSSKCRKCGLKSRQDMCYSCPPVGQLNRIIEILNVCLSHKAAPPTNVERLQNNTTERFQETCAETVSKYKHYVPLLKRGHKIPTNTVVTALLKRIASMSKLNKETFVLQQHT
jgi:hypothetical protein